MGQEPQSNALAARPGVPVAVRRLDPHLPAPTYAHEGDAGADLCAAADVELKPGERALVPTGIAIALPVGYVGLVHPRSGLAAKLGVTVLNAPGTIDSDYRGEVQVLLVNLGHEVAIVRHGDRIAQLVVAPVARIEWAEDASLAATVRGAGGFGSTGRR